MRRFLLIAGSVLVSTILVAFVLREVPLQEVIAAIRDTDPVWVFIGFLLTLASIWTRAIRWRGLLRNQITPRDAFFIMGITFTLNQLPLRAGEVARTFAASQRNVPIFEAATSIVVERLLDLFIVIMLILFSVAQLPDASPDVTNAALLFALLGSVALVVLLLLVYFDTLTRRIVDRLIHLLPVFDRLPLQTWLDQVLTGLQPLTDGPRLFHALLWTLISWFVSLITLLTLVIAIDLQTDLWLFSALGLGLASLSIAVPLSIASIGLIEGAIQFTGELMNAETTRTTALGFLYHGVAVLGYLAIGIPGLMSLGIRLQSLFRPAQAEQRPEAP